MCVFLSTRAHETAGAARTRSSLRPLCFWGERICKTRAKSRRENERLCLPILAQPVMPGLDPGIHQSSQEFPSKGMDCRVKPGNDDPSRRVGKAKRAHQSRAQRTWWARRKGAFAHPTERTPLTSRRRSATRAGPAAAVRRSERIRLGPRTALPTPSKALRTARSRRGSRRRR
jgi:hypothetical protein